MKRTSLLVLVAAILAGCLCPLAPLFVLTSTPTPVEPTLLAQFTPSADTIPPPRPTPTPTHVRSTGSGSLTLVRLHPDDGALSLQLGEEADKAQALGQHMFVEFDAEW